MKLKARYTEVLEKVLRKRKTENKKLKKRGCDFTTSYKLMICPGLLHIPEDLPCCNII